MEIKKHTFDVLNVEDLQRSLGNCFMRFNDSVIMLREFHRREEGIACTASKIVQNNGSDLIGREFRLGVNQLRAAFDPDNLLPIVRSGFVNIYEDDGAITGRYFLQRKVGGYVRGYGERSVRVGGAHTDGPHVGSSWTSDSYRVLRVLHSAFTGGMYVSFDQAVATLTDAASSYATQVLALSPTMILIRSGSEVRLHYSMCPGVFRAVCQDDGSYKVDTRSNRILDSRTSSAISRILPKVLPCL